MLITSVAILSLLARSQADPVMCHTVRAEFVGPSVSGTEDSDCSEQCYTSGLLLHSWLATEGRDICFPSESDICLRYEGLRGEPLGLDLASMKAILQAQPMKTRFDRLGLEGCSAWEARWIETEEQMPTAIAYYAQVDRFCETFKRFFWAKSKKLPKVLHECTCMATITFQSAFVGHPPHLTHLSCALEILQTRLQRANWEVTLIESLGIEFVCLNAPGIDCQCGGTAAPFCNFNHLHRGSSGGKGTGKVFWG